MTAQLQSTNEGWHAERLQNKTYPFKSHGGELVSCKLLASGAQQSSAARWANGAKS